MLKQKKPPPDPWALQIEKEILGKINEEAKLLKEELEQTPKTITRPVVTIKPATRILNFNLQPLVEERSEMIQENPDYAILLKKVQSMTGRIPKITQFRAALEGTGNNPIAVVPTKTWEMICKNTNLLRFEKMTEGKVGADVQGLVKLSEYIFRMLIMTSCIFVPIAIGSIFDPAVSTGTFPWPISATVFGLLLGAIFFSCRKNIKEHVIAITCLFTVIGTAAVGIPIASAGSFQNINIWQLLPVMGYALMAVTFMAFQYADDDKQFYRMLKLLPMNYLVRKLWPNRIDLAIQTGLQVNTISPIFPTPDEQFSRVLRSLEKNADKLCVAAELKAVSVSRVEVAHKLVEIEQYKEHQRQIQIQIAEKERRQRALMDPIVYMASRDGESVAILGQFGEFSQEKKAIRLVKEADLEQLV